MRLLNIFGALLIAGIASSSSIYAPSPIIYEIHREFQDLDGFLPTIQQLATLDRGLKENCVQNGGIAAYNNLQDGMRVFMNCVNWRVEIRRLYAKWEDAQLNGRWKSFFNDYCPEQLILAVCSARLLDSFKTCLEPQKREVFDVYRDITTLMIEFGCHDGGDEFASFVESGGLVCLDSKQENLKSCAVSFFGDLDFPAPSEIEIPTLAKLSSLNWGPKKCRYIEDFRSCAVPEFENCANPASAKVLDSMITSFKNLSPCRNVTPSQDVEFDESSIDESSGTVLRKKCEKNGGPTAYDNYQESKRLASDVANLLSDGKDLRSEIFDIEKIGELDVKKYCRRAPIAIDVDGYVVDSIKSCLEPEEKRSVDILHKLASSALKYVCQDEGDRLEKFIAGGGPACVSSQVLPLVYCLYPNMYSYFEAFSAEGLEKTENLPSTRREFFNALDKFARCSVKALSHCDDDTSKQFLYSIFERLSKETTGNDEFEIMNPRLQYNVAKSTR